MNHDKKKNIVITGASSGIGEATARTLAAQGHRVFLGSRREDSLRAVVADIQRDGGEAESPPTGRNRPRGLQRLSAGC